MNTWLRSTEFVGRFTVEPEDETYTRFLHGNAVGIAYFVTTVYVSNITEISPPLRHVTEVLFASGV